MNYPYYIEEVCPMVFTLEDTGENIEKFLENKNVIVLQYKNITVANFNRLDRVLILQMYPDQRYRIEFDCFVKRTKEIHSCIYHIDNKQFTMNYNDVLTYLGEVRNEIILPYIRSK